MSSNLIDLGRMRQNLGMFTNMFLNSLTGLYILSYKGFYIEMKMYIVNSVFAIELLE